MPLPLLSLVATQSGHGQGGHVDAAFKALDAVIRRGTDHSMCPQVVSVYYGKLKNFLWEQTKAKLQPQDPQQEAQAGGSGSGFMQQAMGAVSGMKDKCSIMW